MSSVKVNPNYIRRFFTGPKNEVLEWAFSINNTFATTYNYPQFLFVHNIEASSEDFKKKSSIKGTKFLVEHIMDDEVKEYLSRNTKSRVGMNINEYRVYTFFKKFGKGSGSVENDCLRFAESLAIGKYPYRGSRSFMKDNITENLIGESYERNFQISNEILDIVRRGDKTSPYNGLNVLENVNEYANPDIGQCYGMLSIWSPEDYISMPYHFACVLFKDINYYEDNLMSNITVEANVGDDSLQLPQFHIYDVGYDRRYKNNSFHNSWKDSFITYKVPTIKINVSQRVNKSGETIITKTPPPPIDENEYYDNWGFLIKNDNYVLSNLPHDPVTIVAVLKETKLNPNIKIIPKPFERQSVTPKSPTASPITSPENLPFMIKSPAPYEPSPLFLSSHSPKSPTPPRGHTRNRRANAAQRTSAARARRIASATRRRRENRATNIRTARERDN